MKFSIKLGRLSVLHLNSDFMNKIKTNDLISHPHSQLNNYFLVGRGFYHVEQEGGRLIRN